MHPPIAFSLSALKRAFLCGWATVLTMGVILVVMASLAAVFYARGDHFVEERIRDKLRVVASVGASNFEAADLHLLRVEKDYLRPEWPRVIRELNRIRSSDPDIRFAYILRLKEDDPQAMVFVADSDSLDPYAHKDLDADGLMTEADEMIAPGSVYDGAPAEAFAAYTGAVTTADFYTDQWGTFMSGFAPIPDGAGRTAAVLGIDIKADRYIAIERSIFSLSIVMLSIFGALCIMCIVLLLVWRQRLQAQYKVERERSGLLSITFHQLGTPVAIMKWALEEFMTQRSAKTRKQVMNRAKSGLKRIENILSALKEADEVRRGNLKSRSGRTSLIEVIDEAIADVKGPQVRARVRVETDGRSRFVVRMDRNSLRIVVDELLGNALDFSPRGSEVVIRVRRSLQSAFLEIEDGGVGIPAPELKYAGEKYFRASNAMMSKPDGNGLGLYIVRGFVERAGGNMQIESRLGKGTKVTFTLPLA